MAIEQARNRGPEPGTRPGVSGYDGGRGTVVVTGASSGIGEACTLRLDQLGFRVFAGVRRAVDGEALRRKSSERLRWLQLDVTDTTTLSAAAEAVESAAGGNGLQGLVNNAGVSIVGPLEFLPIDALRRQLEVNVTGQIAVTQAFLPLLRRGRGRIVMMSSVSGRMVFPFLGPYCASKFALEALSRALRVELAPWGIGVSVIGPGAVATRIWERSGAVLDQTMQGLPEHGRAMYQPSIAATREYGAGRGRASIAPEVVVDAVVEALTSRTPRKRYVVGRDAKFVELLRRLPLSDRTVDRLLVRAMRLPRRAVERA